MQERIFTAKGQPALTEPKWEIVHWPNKKRVEMCDSKSVAERLLPSYGKNHVIREVWFLTDGTLHSHHGIYGRKNAQKELIKQNSISERIK
jgi:hypothetical protein